MKNNLVWSGCIAALLLLSSQVSADVTKNIKGKLQDGIFDELGSTIASLPGISYISDKVRSNRVQLITVTAHAGQLKLTDYGDIESAILTPKGHVHGFTINQSPSVPAGRYELVLRPKNPKKQRIIRTIDIEATARLDVDTKFWYSTQKQFPLTINTRPDNARVRVMNIKPKYQAGMKLPAGKYRIEVSSPGFKKKNNTVTLDHHQQIFTLALDKSSSKDNVERIVVTGSR